MVVSRMHPAARLTLAILLVTRSNCKSAIGGRQKSNCNVHISDSEEGRVSVRVSSPPFHLTCNVTLQMTQLLRIICLNSSSVKVIRNPNTVTTRITCGSNHLINWAPDFLDDSWAAQANNSYALLQRRYGTGEYEGRGFGFHIGANESLNTLVISPEGRVSTLYTIRGLAEVDGAVRPWTDPPIAILLLVNPPQGGATEGDLAIYTQTFGDETAQFLAFEDILEIPCLSSNISWSHVPDLEPNPILMIEEQLQGDCHPSLLTPPISTFDPLRGFSLNTSTFSANGIYYYCCPEMAEHCLMPGCIEFKVYHRQSVEASPRMPFSFSLADAPLRLFVTSKDQEESSVKLECRFSSPMQLTGQLNSVPLKLTAGAGNYTVRQIKFGSRPRYLATLEWKLQEGDMLQVECVDTENSTLYSWNITVHDAGPPAANNHDPTYLKLFPFQGAIRIEGSPPDPVLLCYSDVYDDATVQMVQCIDPKQCSLLESGLDSDEEGYYSEIIHKGSECSRPEAEERASCQRIQLRSPGAMLRCSAGGYSYKQLRWVGLSRSSIFLYTELDFMNPSMQQEMIILQPGSTEQPDRIDVYYTQMVYNFTCFVHTFWSGGLARFVFGMQGNDSGLRRANGTTVDLLTHSPFRQTEQVVFPTADVDRVVCQAPVRFRENAWITASIPVRVVESHEPSILNTELDFNWDDITLPKEITCVGEGQPPPSITWSTRGVDGSSIVIGSDPASNVHVANSTGMLNQLTLVFEKLSVSEEGNYTCTAVNGVDKASKDFRVAMVGDTTGRESGQSVWAAAGGSIAAVLVLLIPVAVLGRRLQLRYRRVLDRLDIYKFRYGTKVAAQEAGSAQLPEQRDENGGFIQMVELEVEPEDGTVETALESQANPDTSQAAWLADEQDQPYDIRFEIARTKFRIYKNRPLGSGEFGEVYLGTVRLGNEDGEVEVGIKVPKRNCPPDVLIAMLRELKIMTRLQHENIVNLIGACTVRAEYGELYILMGFCEGGSVEHFLTPNSYRYVEHKDESEAASLPEPNPVPGSSQYCASENLLPRISFSDLVSWCADLASGMEYLASQSIVHRDLAARNALLTKRCVPRSPRWRAKVSDFGLSRQLYGSVAYQQSLRPDVIPARWMAPECFGGTYSTKSDVWAFGITAWEIFSLGELPYAVVNFHDVAQFSDLIGSGMRITEEHRATPETFAKLKECWDENPKKRPSFTNLREFFQSLIMENENTHGSSVT